MPEPDYIDVPIDTDPDVLFQLGVDQIQAFAPDWQPSEGQLDVWMLYAAARIGATLRDVASRVPTAIFRYFGAKLVGLLPIDAAEASTTVRIDVQNTAGYTIPQGTVVGVPSGGEYAPFALVTAAVIPPGASFVTGVAVTALDLGADGTNLAGPGVAGIMLDQLAFVTAVTVLAVTTGGRDAEEDETYINRLVQELSLMSPRPILPHDFAVLARNVTGVERALAIDGYDPSNGTYNNPRKVAVAAIDPLGTQVSAPIKVSIDTYLQSLREANFEVNVIDPTYTTVDVLFTLHVWPGWDPVDVKARVIAALQLYLSPVTWGLPPFGDTKDWQNKTVVKASDLVGVAWNIEGVKVVDTMTLRKGAAAYDVTDVTLTGAAPLAQYGTVDGTSTL